MSITILAIVIFWFLKKWSSVLTFNDYILGNAKPFTDTKGNSGLKDRLVAGQPLQFGSVYNVRKFMELPVHLVEAGMLQELKDHVLCNVPWLVAKITSTSFRYNTFIFYRTSWKHTWKSGRHVPIYYNVTNVLAETSHAIRFNYLKYNMCRI